MSSREDEHHLSNIYGHYWNEICAYIEKNFGPGPPDPEDVAQEVFARYTELKNRSSIDNPRAYLYRAATNYVIDFKRRETVRGSYLQKEKKNNSEKSFDLAPENVLIAREELKSIEAIIKKMPIRQRQCLLLHRIDGLSYAEIARKMNLSGPGVRGIILKAMKEIDQQINE